MIISVQCPFFSPDVIVIVVNILIIEGIDSYIYICSLFSQSNGKVQGRISVSRRRFSVRKSCNRPAGVTS